MRGFGASDQLQSIPYTTIPLFNDHSQIAWYGLLIRFGSSGNVDDVCVAQYKSAKCSPVILESAEFERLIRRFSPGRLS